MRVLITGIGGFVGRYLADYCISHGEEVYGIERNETVLENVRVYPCDITDASAVNKIVSEVKPDAIYHLAGISFVPEANNNPRQAYDIHLYGTMNIYEAVKHAAIHPKILYVGSSEVYGKAPEEKLPINENTALNPHTIYGASKASADILSGYYGTTGLSIVRVRPFNHTGPGQNPSFVCSDFACQIAGIEKGTKEPVLEVGNLNAKRDFTDVRDVVRAYWMLMNNDNVTGDTFNVCSGQAVAIEEILHILLSLSRTEIKVNPDKNKLRPSDIPLYYGDNRKLMTKTGWKPAIPLEKTLEDMLEYWRRQ